jgi:hypothetical protein
MKYITLILVLLFSFSFVMANENSTETTQSQCQQAIKQLTSYGIIEGNDIPNIIPYKNEVMNVYLKDQTFLGHITISDKVLSEINCEQATEPTYNVYITSLDLIDQTLQSDDPLGEFNSKLSSKEIDLQGTTGGKKFKAGFTKFALKVASWFS